MSERKNSSSAAKIKMESFEDLFKTGENTGSDDQIKMVPLEELHTFEEHPFLVVDDEKMQETVESIKQHGVLVPAIVRPIAEGGYEIIAGHRRRRASELAGLTEIPVIVREYSDDEATIIMVDSNIQREDILPSEKAKAYKMKFDAMKHQGSKNGALSYEAVGEAAGDNAKKVQRYLRIALLIPELLELVDKRKLGFMPAVDISYLSKSEQKVLYGMIQALGKIPNLVQASVLKQISQNRQFNEDLVAQTLLVNKPKKAKKAINLSTKRIKEYFPETFSYEEMEDVIYTLLEKWKKERE